MEKEKHLILGIVMSIIIVLVVALIGVYYFEKAPLNVEQQECVDNGGIKRHCRKLENYKWCINEGGHYFFSEFGADHCQFKIE